LSNSQPQHSQPQNKSATQQKSLHLENVSAQELAALCGQFDKHIQQIEQRLAVRILHRGNQFSIEGKPSAIEATVNILQSLLSDVRNKTNNSSTSLTPDHVHLAIQQFHHEHDNSEQNTEKPTDKLTLVRTKKISVKPRGRNQQNYVRSVLTNDI